MIVAAHVGLARMSMRLGGIQQDDSLSRAEWKAVYEDSYAGNQAP